MAEDNRPSVYFDPDVDRWVYRASALGSCERELVAHRRGQTGSPTPDWLQTRFDEGHDWEARILERFEEDTNLRAHARQGTVTLLVGNNVAVRGSIDGAAIGGCIVDAKFLGPDLFDQIKSKGLQAFPHYWWQQGVYFHGWNAQQQDPITQVPMVCLAMGLKDIEGKGDDRKIVGIKEMHYLWVDPEDLPSVAQIKARVMRLEKLADADGWPDCPTPFQYPCPFEWLHDERDVAVEIDDEALAGKLEQAQTYTELAKESESSAKFYKAEAKKLVEEVLAAEDLTLDAGHKLRAGNLEVTWVYSKTEAAVIEKYERKESVRRFPKFTVKENTDGND